MATKYKDYYKRMLDTHKQEFEAFKIIHDEYEKDEDGMQERFNKDGEKIMEIVNDWENKLCKQSEKGGYGNFTTNLAEKFRGELRKDYPMIDFVGITVNYTPPQEQPSIEGFNLKKISLQ